MRTDDSGSITDASIAAVKQNPQPESDGCDETVEHLPQHSVGAPNRLANRYNLSARHAALSATWDQDILDFAAGDPLKPPTLHSHTIAGLTPPLMAGTQVTETDVHVTGIRPRVTDAGVAPIPSPLYTGEGMGLRLDAKQVTVGARDTLSAIARRTLGSNASAENIAKYVKEIQHANGFSSDKIVKGKTLALPGHTADGGYVVIKGNVTCTNWAHGRQQFDYKDGRKFTRTPVADGSYSEQHTGPRPEDNFGLTRTTDGRYLVSDKPGSLPVEVTDNMDVRVAHAKLHDVAVQKIKDPAERAKFEADMVRFEARAREKELSNDEVAKTFGEIRTLLEARTGAVPANRRIQLAQQVMAMASDPRIIDQGDKNTCSVTHVQAMVFTTDPARGANLITQVALSGRYRDAEGTIVRFDARSLTPDHEARRHPSIDGERSFATQLFNVAATNLSYQREGVARRYEQHAPDRIDPEDSGERLFDTSKSPRKEIAREPLLDDYQIVEAYRGITSRKGGTVLIDHDNNVDGPHKNVDTVKTEQELVDKLAQLKHSKQLPVMFGVNSAVEPFYSDSGGGAAGGSGGGHVVTVTDFDPGPPASVALDNSWGSTADKRNTTLSVRDLYIGMMKTPDAAYELERDIIADRKNNAVSTFKEYELLRLKREGDLIDDKQYGTELAEQLDHAHKRFIKQRADGTFNQEEFEKATSKFEQLRENLTPPQALPFAKEAFDRGALSQGETADLLVDAMSEALEERDQLIKNKEYTGDKKREFETLQRDFKTILNGFSAQTRRDIMRRLDAARTTAMLGEFGLPPAVTLDSGPKTGSDEVPASSEATAQISAEDEAEALFNKVFEQPEMPGLAQSNNSLLGVKGLGRIASFNVPEGWVKGKERDDANGYNYSFHLSEKSKVSLNLMYRGRPLDDTTAGALREVLNQPHGHQLTSEELSQLRTLLQSKADAQVFQISSARVENIDGKMVLAIKGRYKDQAVDAAHIYADAGSNGKIVQEIAYIAPRGEFAKHWPTADRAIRSIKWH